jgi:hypothetical protein
VLLVNPGQRPDQFANGLQSQQITHLFFVREFGGKRRLICPPKSLAPGVFYILENKNPLLKEEASFIFFLLPGRPSLPSPGCELILTVDLFPMVVDDDCSASNPL